LSELPLPSPKRTHLFHPVPRHSLSSNQLNMGSSVNGSWRPRGISINVSLTPFPTLGFPHTIDTYLDELFYYWTTLSLTKTHFLGYDTPSAPRLISLFVLRRLPPVNLARKNPLFSAGTPGTDPSPPLFPGVPHLPFNI